MCILIMYRMGYTLWVINYVYFAFKNYIHGKQIIYMVFMEFYFHELYPLYGISAVYIQYVCVLYNVCLGEWITPTVTGDRPPPIDNFTLTSATNNTAVLFGGNTTNGDSNNVYTITFTKTSVVSVLISIIY